MARTNKRGLELTFHKTGRWCKYIQGKTYYFGKGRGVSDRDSYRDALERYRTFIDERASRAMNPQRDDFSSEADYLAAMYRSAAEFEERISRLVSRDPELSDYVKQLKRREFAQ